jgi:hypothetical protein
MKIFESNIQLRDCAEDCRQSIRKLIVEYWEVFTEEGLGKTIQGYKFHIDKGNCRPICCQQKEYGAQEGCIITKLCEGIEKNGFIEDDDRPCGAIVVFVDIPNQEHKHWSEFVWRLCVPYCNLNAVTRPFTFPAPRCDYYILELGPNRLYITMDTCNGRRRCQSRAKQRRHSSSRKERKGGRSCQWELPTHTQLL